jgi:hypothetical protein
MKQDGNTKKTLERLEDVLDTFGADSNRWPEAERTMLETLIRTNKPAARLVDEAKALARMMDAAPSLRANTELSARIVTAAIDDAVREAKIVPLALKRGRASLPFSTRNTASVWPAAALAASFAFGLYMGIAGYGGTALEGVFQIALIESSADDANSISWLEDSTGGEEEGLL